MRPYSKSPKDLTALVEQVSGSDELKKDYEETLRGKHRLEEDQHSAFTKRKTLMTQRKQMKARRRGGSAGAGPPPLSR